MKKEISWIVAKSREQEGLLLSQSKKRAVLF